MGYSRKNDVPEAQNLAFHLTTPWIVALTKPKCEKRLALYLQTTYPQHSYLLPLIITTHNRDYSSRPLFPGFLFAALPHDHHILPQEEQQALLKQHLLASRLVYSFLTTPNQPLLQRELSLLAASSQEERSPAPPLTTNSRIRINGGPFMGFQAIVIDPAPGLTTTVLVQLELLGRALTAEIPTDLLEAM